MSFFSLKTGKHEWQLSGEVHDLSIPLNFDGEQPNHFGAPKATAAPYKVNGFVGDTRQGGSCNCEQITLVPHCNGTHTESVGHVCHAKTPVPPLCPALPALTVVVSITPGKASQSSDDLASYSDAEDLVIDRAMLERTLKPYKNFSARALVIRTLPNHPGKVGTQYDSAADSAYLTQAAAATLVKLDIEHLLVDLPSIDRFNDEGKLAAHRVFFGLPPAGDQNASDIEHAQRAHTTVTEMIYVPDIVSDGMYALNLQVAPFSLNASPSRPLLYALEAS